MDETSKRIGVLCVYTLTKCTDRCDSICSRAFGKLAGMDSEATLRTWQRAIDYSNAETSRIEAECSLVPAADSATTTWDCRIRYVRLHTRPERDRFCVNFETQVRTPKDSALFYRDLLTAPLITGQ